MTNKFYLFMFYSVFLLPKHSQKIIDIKLTYIPFVQYHCFSNSVILHICFVVLLNLITHFLHTTTAELLSLLDNYLINSLKGQNPSKYELMSAGPPRQNKPTHSILLPQLRHTDNYFWFKNKKITGFYYLILYFWQINPTWPLRKCLSLQKMNRYQTTDFLDTLSSFYIFIFKTKDLNS